MHQYPLVLRCNSSDTKCRVVIRSTHSTGNGPKKDQKNYPPSDTPKGAMTSAGMYIIKKPI